MPSGDNKPIAKLIVKILLAIVISLVTFFFQTPVALEYVAPPEIVTIDPDLPLKEWLYELEGYESRHRHDIKILDVNNKYSYGCLQFQRATFEWAGLKYAILTPQSDIDALIMDCPTQHRIALAMLKNERNPWRHWYTSVEIKGLGRPPLSTGGI